MPWRRILPSMSVNRLLKHHNNFYAQKGEKDKCNLMGLQHRHKLHLSPQLYYAEKRNQ